ncbi:MAG: M36 family metallopeptidase, partial [Acidobacteria bacterium]|nr:M36 family metallopeptidase [Acidobacteriota bacterium]
MRSHFYPSQARRAAWLFTFLLLAQPLLVAAGSSPSQTGGDKSSKWNDVSLQSSQRPQPIIEGKPDGAILPVWERLQQAAWGDLKVFWQRRAGTPEAIYGLMADVSVQLGDPEAAARDFLTKEAALFKIRSTADLQLLKLSESIGGYHVFFQQTYHGLPVHDALMGVPGMMGVHIDRAGRIHALVSSYQPDVSLSTLRPNISSEDIYERMLAELGARGTPVVLLGEPRRALVVSMTHDGAHLAWQITVPARAPLGAWQAFWDAQTGERISPLQDRNYYVNGTGRVFDPNAVVATANNGLTDQNDSAGAVPSNAYSTVTLLDLDGSGFLNGPFVNTGPTSGRVNRSSHNFTDLDRSEAGFEEVETYWSIDDAQRYIQSFSIFNAAHYSIGCNVNGIADDNSFYSGFGNGRGQITLGRGGVDDAEDAEIIWHEYGHAMLDNQVINMNQNFDGMGEGWGDYWAATNAVRHPSTNHAMYDPAVGEWDATSYNPGNPPFLRRVDTTAHYPEDRSGDPHVTGMIWSGACWDIQNSITRLTADHIFLEGNFLMPFSPTLPQAAQAMLQADQNINGGANNVAMTAVYNARGLINPQAPSITVTSPNGGEWWQIGTTQTIIWNSTGISGNVRIRLSRNGGISFSAIFSSVPNTGSKQWTVTGPATTQARIQVVNLSDNSIRDTSDANFTISNNPPPPSNSVTVTSPNGGENWQIGSSQIISWTTTGSIANVKIELSRTGVAGPYE